MRMILLRLFFVGKTSTMPFKYNRFIVPLFLLSLSLSAQTDTLRLIFAGDIMGHAPQISSAKTANGGYDYAPCFKYVKPILEGADIAIGNLELTLPGKAP